MSTRLVGQDLRERLALVTENELAEALELTAQTLITWRRLKTGPSYVKLGKSVFYREADINQWIRSSVPNTTSDVAIGAVNQEEHYDDPT